MNITAHDIRTQDFVRRLRGFDIEEVLAFLDTVADAFEQRTKEKAELEEQVRALEGAIKQYGALETTLRDTLITAQRATEEVRENARREAELILREARIAAEAEIEEARKKAIQIKKDIVDLRSHKETFVARLKALSRSHMDILQAFDREEEELPWTSVDEREVPSPPLRKNRTPPPISHLTEDTDEERDASER